MKIPGILNNNGEVIVINTNKDRVTSSLNEGFCLFRKAELFINRGNIELKDGDVIVNYMQISNDDEYSLLLGIYDLHCGTSNKGDLINIVDYQKGVIKYKFPKEKSFAKLVFKKINTALSLL